MTTLLPNPTWGPVPELIILVHASDQNQAQEQLAGDLARHLHSRVRLLGLASVCNGKSNDYSKIEAAAE